jgi:hypothetical protein
VSAGAQTTLEIAYKQELGDAFGVKFNNLFTLTNMPIKRFADSLYQKGELQSYMQLLLDAFNPAAAECAPLSTSPAPLSSWMPAPLRPRPSAQGRDVQEPGVDRLEGPHVRLRLQPAARHATADGPAKRVRH